MNINSGALTWMLLCVLSVRGGPVAGTETQDSLRESSIRSFAESGNPRLTCSTPSIEAVEGDDVTLRYQLDPLRNLSALTVDVKRDDNREMVHVYRHGKDYIDPQNDHYRNRTTLSHADLIRGILTLQISSVNLSDSGPYKGFVPKWRAGSVCHLTVVKKDQQTSTEGGGSSPSRPPVADHDGDNRKSVRAGIISTVVVVILGLLIGFLFLKVRLRAKKEPKPETAVNRYETMKMNTQRAEGEDDVERPAGQV